jgi:uncharacterized Zn finger protein
MSWNGNNSFPSKPRKARGGIRARSENGEFARNWWAQRWIEAMERLVRKPRLQRGQRYARMGQVLSMEETRHGINARVQGSRAKPYKVTIEVAPLSDRQWEKVLDVLSGQAIFAAQLLAGEMPAQIDGAFASAGVSLFPHRAGDLKTACSCPDWANPCKHVAAVHYILGDRFDEDPFLLFRLRGRTQEQILEGLRKRRSNGAEAHIEELEEEELAEENIPALEETLDYFWETASDLDTFGVNVKPPAFPLPILKRLGEPDFPGQIPLEEVLGDAYHTISQFALAIAFAGVEGESALPEEEGSGAADQA